MGWLAIALVAVAVSFDGLAVGSAYGFRGTRVPPGSLLLIGLTSTVLAGVAMAIGTRMAPFLPPSLAIRLGGILLLGLGTYLMLRAWRQGREGAGHQTGVGPGLIFEVWRDPHAADIDRSGRLDGAEAVVLGLTLALDAVAAAMAAGLSGWGYALPLVVGPVQALMVYAGARGAARMRLGHGGGWSYLPGGILLAVALLRLR